MAGIERGNYEAPKKSAWNFEVYDSGHERRMMERLETEPAVRKWTKRHGIAITWVDSHHRQHSYRPDFLVEYGDGSLALIEVKAVEQGGFAGSATEAHGCGALVSLTRDGLVHGGYRLGVVPVEVVDRFPSFGGRLRRGALGG